MYTNQDYITIEIPVRPEWLQDPEKKQALEDRIEYVKQYFADLVEDKGCYIFSSEPTATGSVHKKLDWPR